VTGNKGKLNLSLFLINRHMMKACGPMFLIMFKEINSVYCDKHTKHRNKLRG